MFLFFWQLMSSVRIPLLTRDFLMNQVESEDLMTSNATCKDLLIEAMKYHLMPEKRNVLASQRTKERKGRRSRPVIFACGKYLYEGGARHFSTTLQILVL